MGRRARRRFVASVCSPIGALARAGPALKAGWAYAGGGGHAPRYAGPMNSVRRAVAVVMATGVLRSGCAEAGRGLAEEGGPNGEHGEH